MSASHQQITASLLELSKRIEGGVLLPALFPAATDLVQTDPYAFCLATCLDRGTMAEVIWTIPYWIRDDLGHLDPFLIAGMALEELSEVVSRLPKRPRYHNAAPRDATRAPARTSMQLGITLPSALLEAFVP